MITTKKELREYLEADNAWYRPSGLKEKIIDAIAYYPWRSIKRYLVFLRKHEYYYNTCGRSVRKKLLKLYYERRKNRLGERLGIEISPNCFGKGLNISHAGCIVVNTYAKIGENCCLHGNNCIGNNALTPNTPILGNNVDIGFGATIIGGITLANDITIGANSVVSQSFIEPDCIIAGVPAKIIRFKCIERGS